MHGMKSLFMPRTQAILSPKCFHAMRSYAYRHDINSENTYGVEISGTRNGPLFIHYCSPCVLSMINHHHYLESSTKKCSNLQKNTSPHLIKMKVRRNTTFQDTGQKNDASTSRPLLCFKQPRTS